MYWTTSDLYCIMWSFLSRKWHSLINGTRTAEGLSFLRRQHSPTPMDHSLGTLLIFIPLPPTFMAQCWFPSWYIWIAARRKLLFCWTGRVKYFPSDLLPHFSSGLKIYLISLKHTCMLTLPLNIISRLNLVKSEHYQLLLVNNCKIAIKFYTNMCI